MNNLIIKPITYCDLESFWICKFMQNMPPLFCTDIMIWVFLFSYFVCDVSVPYLKDTQTLLSGRNSWVWVSPKEIHVKRTKNRGKGDNSLCLSKHSYGPYLHLRSPVQEWPQTWRWCHHVCRWWSYCTWFWSGQPGITNKGLRIKGWE